MSSDDDDLKFLLQAAAKNKEEKEKKKKEEELPDEIFKDLPTKPSEEYPDGNFPERDIIMYKSLKNEHVGYRPNNYKQEKELEYLKEARPLLREAGLIHQKVRTWSIGENGPIKPGAKLWDICNSIEEAVRREVNYDINDPLKRCLGFPCGCSINNEAAHYSPTSKSDGRTLGNSDVMKIDFGVAIDGNIFDSAFTVCFDERFKPLIDASKDATNSAIRLCGPDARISEIADNINEVIRSYQLEIDGKILPLKPISNLGGHGLGKYRVHCGKRIPNVKELNGFGNLNAKMEIGEYYALETFATTGSGRVFRKGQSSHFMLNPKAPKVKMGSLRALAECIQKNYSTMAFCQRFLDRIGQRNYGNFLDKLVQLKVVDNYPPLLDTPGSYVSQYEHSFGIFEEGIEVFSRDSE